MSTPGTIKAVLMDRGQLSEAEVDGLLSRMGFGPDALLDASFCNINDMVIAPPTFSVRKHVAVATVKASIAPPAQGAVNKPDYSGYPGYTDVLARLGMDNPALQYGFYTSIGGGVLYGLRQVLKARAVHAAAKITSVWEREELMATHGLEDRDLRHAKTLARKFMLRGVMAGIGMPLAYLGWRYFNMQAKKATEAAASSGQMAV